MHVVEILRHRTAAAEILQAPCKIMTFDRNERSFSSTYLCVVALPQSNATLSRIAPNAHTHARIRILYCPPATLLVSVNRSAQDCESCVIFSGILARATTPPPVHHACLAHADPAPHVRLEGAPSALQPVRPKTPAAVRRRC